jgi:hypothetical protein
MPDPLSDSLAEQLEDPTTALAAAVVIAGLHPGILEWAARTVSAEPAPEPRRRKQRKVNGQGNGRSRAPGRDAYFERLRGKRDRADEALLKAMKAAPVGSINGWATSRNKPHSSTVAALHRLRDAGLAEPREGRWRLVEESPPREASKWVAPLSGAQRARVLAHAGA